MGLVADEYAAADNYYFFTEPLFVRYPTNTDQVFHEYVNNPEEFEEFGITRDYLGQRLHDLKNDLGNLKLKGETPENYNKMRYYNGLINQIQALFFKSEEIGQSDTAEEYNLAQRELKKIRSENKAISTYYYYKGQSDICKQILLNTPLYKKEVAG